MNWVGGSRNRLVMKNDAKRQKEFFEKRKLQQRLKNLGIALPQSPQGTASGSMDLVTLFIVNQIAAKKEIKDPPNVAVLGSFKGGSKQRRNKALVLPMSPCSPSQLNFVEGKPHDSIQGTTKRKHTVSQGFQYRQLSPVLESVFSDSSASDYLPPAMTDSFSPFSSTSSSGQELFPLQLNLQQRKRTQSQPPSHFSSPPPWDTSGLEQTDPRGMTESISWSTGSNRYQMETPTAATCLFRSPEPDNTKARDTARQEVDFSVNQPEDREPLLDFTLNSSENELQLDQDIFSGFCAEEYEKEDSHFGRGKKIFLKDETPVNSLAPQTVPDLQCRGTELSNCTDLNFSSLENHNSPVNGCNCSPSHSCGGGYLSSGSNDEEEYCQVSHTAVTPSLQAPCLHMDPACCKDSQNPIQSSPTNPTQRHTEHSLLTPILKPHNDCSTDHTALESMACRDKTMGTQGQTDLCDSLCKCEKTPRETRDSGTQTANHPMAERCDVWTQCSFVENGGAKATRFDPSPQPVDAAIQHPSTGRQCEPTVEAMNGTPLPDKVKGKSRRKTDSQSFSDVTEPANNCDRRVILKRPIIPFLKAGRGAASQ